MLVWNYCVAFLIARLLSGVWVVSLWEYWMSVDCVNHCFGCYLSFSVSHGNHILMPGRLACKNSGSSRLACSFFLMPPPNPTSCAKENKFICIYCFNLILLLTLMCY